jgi:hypothetical protein
MMFATLDIAHAQYLVSQHAPEPTDTRRGATEGVGAEAVTPRIIRQRGLRRQTGQTT